MTATPDRPDEVTLLVFTDGRDHLGDTLASAREHLKGDIWQTVIVDDSGNAATHRQLVTDYEQPGTVVMSWRARKGFGGSIAAAWQILADLPSYPPWVFHLEDDFLFNQDVDLHELTALMRYQPDLAQIALRRQAWNDVEKAAGGVIQLQPDAYTQRHAQVPFEVDVSPFRWVVDVDWIEHRLYFTTNPCLYPRALCARGWPTLPQSEGVFTHRLLEDPALRFALWGKIEDDPWVEHIGHERVGTGY